MSLAFLGMALPGWSSKMLGRNKKNSLTILGYEKFPGCSIISSKKINYVDNYDYLILWGLAIALGSFKHRFMYSQRDV